jgi:tRNA nucleotidyltransferase (CCA-adding enzyme)
MSGALENKHFYRFIEVLRSCGALEVVLPEVDKLFGVPQTAKYHPEIDTGIHVLMSLKAAGLISSDPKVMFAVLVHDLGKGLTPANELPSHRGHEKKGLKPIKALSSRMAVPNSFKELALKVCEFHLHSHRIFELRPQTVLKLLEQLDGFRNPGRIEQFADSCLADRRGRTGRENESDEASQLLLALHQAALSVNAGEIAREITGEIRAAQDLSSNLGRKIKQAVATARVKAIAEELKASKV